jgi:uncharacterized protein (TIGR00251 family)
MTKIPSPRPRHVRLRVRLYPRARQDRLIGRAGDVLKVQVTAPPVAGEANRALERLLARLAGVSTSSVRVVSGTKGRNKVVEIETSEATGIRARLVGLKS